MTEFEKRVALTLGIFAAVIVPVNLFSAACTFAATALWIWRSLSATAVRPSSPSQRR
jgi:hypothetical protein